MTIAVGDVVQVIDRQTYDAQEILNTYTYRVSGIAPGDPLEAVEIGEAFWTAVKGWIRPAQSPLLSHTAITVEVLTGDRDYATYVIPTGERQGANGAGGDSAPAFVAYGITLVPATRQTRPGSKRICGVMEADLQNYGVILPAVLPALNGLADIISAPLAAGALGTSELIPIIYRPGEGINPPVWNEVVSATVKPTVTTQNTRKRGRGS